MRLFRVWWYWWPLAAGTPTLNQLFFKSLPKHVHRSVLSLSHSFSCLQPSTLPSANDPRARRGKRKMKRLENMWKKGQRSGEARRKTALMTRRESATPTTPWHVATSTTVSLTHLSEERRGEKQDQESAEKRRGEGGLRARDGPNTRWRTCLMSTVIKEREGTHNYLSSGSIKNSLGMWHCDDIRAVRQIAGKVQKAELI